MAYEREDDDLQRQLEQQLGPEPVREMPGIGMSAQPVGGSVAYEPPKVEGLGAVPPSSGGNPLGGANTGVAGGKDLGAPAKAPLAPAAGGALGRYGTADIDGAGDLKAGGYGGEGFSYNERSARGERGANTIKNTFGKIASRYDPTQPGAAKAVVADPDFQRFFPEARIVEHPNGDLIDFGDGKPVDVLRAARAGGSGEAWQWGADDGTGAPAAMAGGGGGMNLQGLLTGDPMAGIQSEVDKLMGGQSKEEQTLIQQLLAEGR